MDKLDEAQQAWRQMNRTQRREFLRWANEWQDARRRTRDATPVDVSSLTPWRGWISAKRKADAMWEVTPVEVVVFLSVIVVAVALLA